jgi:hypothetical protein
MKPRQRFLCLSATVAALLAGAVWAMIVSPDWASAARPHKNARYFGFEGSETSIGYTDQTAKARVSGSGRRFRRGSYVDLTFFCSRNDPS